MVLPSLLSPAGALGPGPPPPADHTSLAPPWVTGRAVSTCSGVVTGQLGVRGPGRRARPQAQPRPAECRSAGCFSQAARGVVHTARWRISDVATWMEMEGVRAAKLNNLNPSRCLLAE